jgi:hypothetical protein
MKLLYLAGQDSVRDQAEGEQAPGALQTPTLAHMTVIKQCQDQAEGEQAPGALQTPTLAARNYGAHTTVIKP